MSLNGLTRQFLRPTTVGRECVDLVVCARGAAASAEAYIVAMQWVVWFELCWFDT